MARQMIDIEGLLYAVEPQKEAGTSTLVEIVIEEVTDKSYKNYWIAQLWNDKIDFIDRFRIGDKVVCHCHVNGRKWTNENNEDKYFLSLNCFGIGDPDNPTTPKKKKKKDDGYVGDGATFPDDDTENKLSFSDDEETDDLPF